MVPCLTENQTSANVFDKNIYQLKAVKAKGSFILKKKNERFYYNGDFSFEKFALTMIPMSNNSQINVRNVGKICFRQFER